MTSLLASFKRSAISTRWRHGKRFQWSSLRAHRVMLIKFDNMAVITLHTSSFRDGHYGKSYLLTLTYSFYILYLQLHAVSLENAESISLHVVTPWHTFFLFLLSWVFSVMLTGFTRVFELTFLKNIFYFDLCIVTASVMMICFDCPLKFKCVFKTIWSNRFIDGV